MTTSSIILINTQFYPNYDYMNISSPVEIDSPGSTSNSAAYSNHINISPNMDASNSAECAENPEMPFLSIVKQPQTTLRFRYKSEKGNHGGLKPVVKLENCRDPSDIFIKASFYMDQKTPHVIDLHHVKHCIDGICWVQLDKYCVAKFPSLSICTKKKDEILNILRNRKKSELKKQRKKINEQLINDEVLEEFKLINLNSGILCFEAFYKKKELICDKCFSIPISNQKSSVAGDLKISVLSSCSGKATGGDYIVLLCDKVRKDDIEIRFFEKDENNERTWEEQGKFNANDVHHQVAIPFFTPPYKENVDKLVSIELYRKSDGKSGEPRDFHYYADDDFDYKSLKRKRCESPNEFAIQNLSSTSTLITSSPSKDDESSQHAISLDTSIFDSMMPLSDMDLNELLKDLPPIFPDCQILDVQDNVQIEAAVNDLASLTISSSKNGDLQNIKKKQKMNTDVPPGKNLQDFKEGIISILRSRRDGCFMKFLPILMTFTDENDNSLLHLAIMEKSENLLLLIYLLKQAPVKLRNQANKFKWTPLHLAVSKGLWKIVRILLMCGADPNLKNQDGNNCIHLATKLNFSMCLNEILAPLLSDKKREHIPKINALNYDGLAPLHFAVINDCKICAEALINARADINIPDGKNGKSPLHIAYECKSKLVEYLLSQDRINKNALDFKGYAPNSSKPTLCEKKNVKRISEDCYIEIKSECSSSEDSDDCMSTEHHKSNEKTIQSIPIETEKQLCDLLDSNGLWRQFGIYVMSKKELDIIADIDPTPTKTLLSELKKRHSEDYTSQLKYILSDKKLKGLAEQLQIL